MEFVPVKPDGIGKVFVPIGQGLGAKLVKPWIRIQKVPSGKTEIVKEGSAAKGGAVFRIRHAGEGEDVPVFKAFPLFRVVVEDIIGIRAVIVAGAGKEEA